MNNTFGDPGFARTGEGHAGEDSPIVRPMRPGNVVPGGYSFSSAFAVAPVSAEAAISELPLSSKSRRLIPFLCSGPTLSGVSLERSFPIAYLLLRPRPQLAAASQQDCIDRTCGNGVGPRSNVRFGS